MPDGRPGATGRLRRPGWGHGSGGHGCWGPGGCRGAPSRTPSFGQGRQPPQARDGPGATGGSRGGVSTLAVAVPEIPEARVLPVVRRLLCRPDARLGRWTAAPLPGGLFATPLRCRGEALAGSGERLSWSCVLKRGTALEADLYGSGLLAALPAPLRAPACHGAEEVDGAWWIWLEDVADARPGPWPAELRAEAARHLGATQAALLATGPACPPAVPPLDPDGLRHPLAEAAELDALWELEPFAALAGRGGRDRLRAVPAGWAVVHAALARAPRVLCHGDFHRPNLCAAHGGGGTVALDWQMAARGWLGHDVAGLAFGTIPEAPALLAPGFAGLERILLRAYGGGLRAGGWAGDRRQAELGYLASTLHRCRLPHLLGMARDPARRGGPFLHRMGGFAAFAACICARTEVALARWERAVALASALEG